MVQQEDGGRFRELHEAHIARLAAENKLAEMQARLTSTSASASQQVTPLIHPLRIEVHTNDVLQRLLHAVLCSDSVHGSTCCRNRNILR